MSCAWRAATPAGCGIIRSSSRSTTTCCGRPRSWSRRARSPSALRNAASSPNGSSPGGGILHSRRTLHAGGPGARLRRAADARSNGTPSCSDMLWGGFTASTPHFGVYGKLGDNKGSFALLDAHASAQARRAGRRLGRARAWPTGGRSDGSATARSELGLDRPRAANSVSSALAGAGIPARLPRGLLPRAGFPDRLSQPDHSARGAACAARAWSPRPR